VLPANERGSAPLGQQHHRQDAGTAHCAAEPVGSEEGCGRSMTCSLGGRHDQVRQDRPTERLLQARLGARPHGVEDAGVAGAIGRTPAQEQPR